MVLTACVNYLDHRLRRHPFDGLGDRARAEVGAAGIDQHDTGVGDDETEGAGHRLGRLASTGQVTVKNTADFKTKSGHERVVFVYGDAREVLERLHAGCTSEADDYVFQGTSNREGTRGHLNPEYVSKRFLHYARMAKLPKGIHFHSLRHTYASWLVMAGVDLFRVKELLGHADISTTMRYAHLAPKAFQDELQRVFG